MQRSLAQSSSLGGEGVPGVGQYTKAVVIPFYQRHSSKSPNATLRHTWGSEQYDTFKSETNDSSDGSRSLSCSDKGSDRERRCSSSETCSSSQGSRSSASISASISGSCGSRSTSGSRDRHRDGDMDGTGTGPPRTPGERKFRTLLHMISNIGSAAPTAMRERTFR
jgi:hypothetical protein